MVDETKNKLPLITREQWIIARQMATAVACLNAPYCDEGLREHSWEENVAREIALNCGGKFALEDAIGVFTKAHDYLENKNGLDANPA